MNKKIIFITGATGKIGKHLLDSLDSTKYIVYALCRNEKFNFNSSPNIVLGDLLEVSSYEPVFKNHIDIVIHLGAVTHTNDINEYYKMNAAATSELIKLCESNEVKKFIFISTRAISDKGGYYSESKLMAETYVKVSKLTWVIMRLAEVYGFSNGQGVDFILNNIKKMPIVPIIGNGKYRIAPVHESDTVSAIIKAIEKDGIEGKIYDIAGPENFTYNEFIDKILELYKIRRIKIHIPRFFAWVFLKICSVIFKKGSSLTMDQLPRLFSEKSYDISEASRDLGFNPSALEKFIINNERF